VIEYRILTKAEVDDWAGERTTGRPGADEPARGIPRAGLQRGPDWIADVACNQELEPDVVRTIAAFDDGRMIGRLHIVYTDLLLEGTRLQRCAVGEDFFVLDEYRDRAVGLSILLKALKLGLPFIESGVSGQMRKILDSWKQFALVDGSPMFQVALDWRGLGQIAKWDFYARQVPGSPWRENLTKLSLLLAGWRQRRSIAGARRGEVQALSAADAVAAFDRCLGSAQAQVQLPWSRRLLEAAVAGSDPNRKAWLAAPAADPSERRLVSLYQQERVLGRNPDGTNKTTLEIHLNEIYPPLANPDRVGAWLAFAFARAAEMGGEVLQVHAMTPALERFCRDRGLRSRMTKSIYVAADGLDGHTRRLLANPANWWCRAFNENQFEEILLGRQVDRREGTPLV